MNSDATTHVFLGSRPRRVARRSFSARRPAKDPKNTHVAAFREKVWKFWKNNGRHDLPWRKTRDPYRILVSEIMLQQTQVSRVSEKYREFLEVFPTVRALARASLLDVLKVWSGLGYNRRAKYLRDAAKVIVQRHWGRVPPVYRELVELPGVGDYTAKAVRVFAFNEPEVLIETNIRSAFIHHFHSNVLPARRSLLARRSFGGVGGAGGQKVRISDKDILPLSCKAAEGQDPREWHWALMDYGAHLKRTGVRNNVRSVHYTRQSKFEGSLRQVRGAILKALTTKGDSTDLRGRYSDRYDRARQSLIKDGLLRAILGPNPLTRSRSRE